MTRIEMYNKLNHGMLSRNTAREVCDKIEQELDQEVDQAIDSFTNGDMDIFDFIEKIQEIASK